MTVKVSFLNPALAKNVFGNKDNLSKNVIKFLKIAPIFNLKSYSNPGYLEMNYWGKS